MTADNLTDQELHFRIDAHAVIQLGEELITDAEQALLELVKNAYDADSSWCKIEIDTNHKNSYRRRVKYTKKNNDTGETGNGASNENRSPQVLEEDVIESVELLGCISISDGGIGMSYKQIRDSWLVISTSTKRPESNQLKTATPKGRMPVGDKGLGRLGTMRLGQFLRITTAVKDSTEKHQVSIWLSDFRGGSLLEDIFVELETLPNPEGRQGTKVEILGLNNLDEWKTLARRQAVHTKLSTLLNPYEIQKSFPVSIIFDGIDLDPFKFTDDVLNLASANFSLKWDDGRLSLTGKIRLSLFRGQSGEQKKEIFTSLIEADKGQALFEHLTKSKKLQALGVKRDHEGYFVSVQQHLTWADIKIPVDCIGAVDPGKLNGEVNYFLFNDIVEPAAATMNIPLKQYIKNVAGISIFKEGFQVRSNQDWLGLREGQTSGGSYYGLRPTNSIGYFEISGHNNPKLTETSNRENFIDNPAYRGFLTIARRFRKFADDSLEELRRARNEFERIATQDGIPPVDAGRIGIAKLAEATEHIATQEKELSRLAIQARTSAKKIEEAFLDPQYSIGFPNDAAASGAKDIIKAVAQLTDRIDKISSAALVRNLEQTHMLVESHFGDLHERNLSLMESAAVGLSARWLSHDVRVFLDDISLAAAKLKQLMSSAGHNESDINSQLVSIHSAVKSIDRIVSFINPLLPQRRTRKEIITLSEFIRTYFEIRKDLFDRSGIKIEVMQGSGANININRGHLLQVLDNLTQNSRYWLTHAIQKSGINEAKICVQINEAGFEFWDTGYGVIENLADALFDLFVTDKPRDEGSGIGLFIVRSLLEANQCSINLATERNTFGRRYKFRVDLTAVSV